jgi:hypothetical protein
MDELSVRLLVLANVVIPLLFFMATVYLALHIVFARVIVSRESPVLWFFAVVTGPLTRPVRAMLPGTTPEPRVRTIALLLYLVLWIVLRAVLAQVVGVQGG